MTMRAFAAVLGAGVWLALIPGNLWAQRKPELRQFELKAESPKFWDLIDRAATMAKVAGDFGFTEGPVWDDQGFLYVSDEIQNKIFRVYADGHKEELLSLGNPDGSTFDAHHRLISTASVRRAVIAVEPDGKYEILADKYEGMRFNTPNDVVLGPDDAIYFTDPTLDLEKGEKQETPYKGVYRLGSDGSVKLLIKDLDQPNGLAFSPDGKRLYVDDSAQRDIHVYDVGPHGEITNGRLFGKEEGSGGVPDGMRVDVKGNLYVTGPLGVWIWDPDGNHLGTVVVPESPANLAWGDTDRQTLYLTAKTSVYRIRTKTKGFIPGAANR
jgi:gluconolactonase